MGRKTVLVDDLTGEELPESTSPIRLSVARKSYDLYLSAESTEGLYAALAPFTRNAEETSTTAPVAPQRADRERTKAIREWAQANNVLHKGKPLGDRGRIPEEIVKAYDEAN